MLKEKEQGPIPALISVFFPLTSDAQKREAAAAKTALQNVTNRGVRRCPLPRTYVVTGVLRNNGPPGRGIPEQIQIDSARSNSPTRCSLLPFWPLEREHG